VKNATKIQGSKVQRSEFRGSKVQGSGFMGSKAQKSRLKDSEFKGSGLFNFGFGIWDVGFHGSSSFSSSTGIPAMCIYYTSSRTRAGRNRKALNL
jgi:hypothetical protein